MQTATQNLVGFFMEIQHSPSEVEELQEYLGCLLTGEEIDKGSLFDEKFGTFTLKDFQESFNWTQSVSLIVTEQICYTDMVRRVECDSMESAQAMVNSNHYRDIPRATDDDWDTYLNTRNMHNYINKATVCIQVDNLHLKSRVA